MRLFYRLKSVLSCLLLFNHRYQITFYVYYLHRRAFLIFVGLIFSCFQLAGDPMTRERSNRPGRRDRHSGSRDIAAPDHRNGRHSRNRTSSFVASTSPTLLPRLRAINSDNAHSQVPRANNPQTLSINTNATDNGGACPADHLYTNREQHGQHSVASTNNVGNSNVSSHQHHDVGRNVSMHEQHESSRQTIVDPLYSSQTTNQTDAMAQTHIGSLQTSDMSNNSSVPLNTQTYMRSNSDSNANSTHNLNTTTLPIVDSVSDYIITELPRSPDSAVRQEQILMMDNSVVSGYNNNSPTHCDDQTRFPVANTDLPVCISPECPPTQPRHGRRRRHRRRRRRHRSRHHRSRRSGGHRDDETYVKPSCCSLLGCKICTATCLQFKKVLIFFAFFGVICVLIGIVLGVLRAPGNSFFTLSLMFVGEYTLYWY